VNRDFSIIVFWEVTPYILAELDIKCIYLYIFISFHWSLFTDIDIIIPFFQNIVRPNTCCFTPQYLAFHALSTHTSSPYDCYSIRAQLSPNLSYCYVSGVPWLIITVSGLDDWIYWSFLSTISLNHNQLTTAHNQPLAEPTRSILVLSHSVSLWTHYSSSGTSHSTTASDLPCLLYETSARTTHR
jgi:hypothetical protein